MKCDITGIPYPTIKAKFSKKELHLIPLCFGDIKEIVAITQDLLNIQRKETLKIAKNCIIKILSNNTCNEAFSDENLKKYTNKEIIDFLILYLEQLSIISQLSRYKIPYCPDISEEEHYTFKIYTSNEKIVSDYSSISILDIQKLNYIDFLILRRDAYIYQLEKTEKGRDYLDTAYCFSQDKPDRVKLRNDFGK